MGSFSEKISDKIMNMSEQKHLKSIKLGIINAMPILQTLGLGIFIVNLLMMCNLEISSKNLNILLLSYIIVNFIFFICLTYGVASNLSEIYGLNKIKCGFLGVLTSTIILFIQYVIYGAASISIYDFMLLLYFPAIIISILTVELFRIFSKIKIKVESLENIPTAAIININDLIPVVLISMTTIILTMFISFKWIDILNVITIYIMKLLASYIGMIVIVTVTSLFWMYGIHGVSIIGVIARPFWIQMIIVNAFNFISGTESAYIVNEIFYQWFVWIGGSGCTLGLVLLMKYKSKSSYLKALGKDNLATSLFNINESIIFGTPIALNKKMMKPFLIAPLVCATISWVAIKSGLVTAPFILAPWVLPNPLGAFIATGGDFSTIMLCMILLVISIIVYYPFFKAYDKSLLEEENI